MWYLYFLLLIPIWYTYRCCRRMGTVGIDFDYGSLLYLYNAHRTALKTNSTAAPPVHVARASDIPRYHQHMADFYRDMIKREYYIQLD